MHFDRWMSSYLTDRTQCVRVDDHLSCEIRLTAATRSSPEQRVGPPTLLCTVLACWKCSLKHGIRYHVYILYADDTQLYTFPRGDSASAVDRIRRCVIDVKAWLASRCLLFNEKKTEAILFAAQKTEQPHSATTCLH